MDDGLRARKKRETRRRLVAAAIELGARDGVEAVTVADIADHAQVSRRTFFNYFSSKEEALVGSSPERIERLAALVAARPDYEPSWTAMRRALAQHYDQDDPQPERSWVARVRLARSQPSLVGPMREHFAALEDALATVIAHRTNAAPDDLHPKLLVALAMTTVRVAIDRWLQESDDDVPLPRSIDDALGRVTSELFTTDAPATAALAHG